MGKHTYPDYAVDLPLSDSEQNASPGKKYYSPDSPFVFIPYSPWWEEGAGSQLECPLVEVRPNRFLSFVLANPPTASEEEVLVAGLRSWVKCPNHIIATQYPVTGDNSSLRHIQTTMLMRAAMSFGFHLKMARGDQVDRRGPLWNSRELFSHDEFRDVDFTLFFLLGGMDQLIYHCSFDQYEQSNANQLVPMLCAVALLHALHKRLIDCSNNTKLRMWGINQAKVEAATLLKSLHILRGVSPENIRNYWQNLKPSAALLYASLLTDNGMLWAWLSNGNSPYYNEYPGRYFHAWFKIANAVSIELLQPIALLPKNWQPLEVQGDCQMPPPLSDEQFKQLLTLELDKKDIYSGKATGRKGEVKLRADGTRFFAMASKKGSV